METSEALLLHAYRVDAGLLVAGAYGHARLNEFLFGGVTQRMLDNFDIPILMTH